jgi:antitoxin component YwqK of YwqJK toxin-antitoxin module
VEKRVQARARYCDELIVGTSYYKNGQIQYEGSWEGGEPHGQGKVYNMNGKLMYDGAWRCGVSNQGIYMERYKNRF